MLRRVLPALVALAVVAGACSDSSGTATDADATTTTTVAAATTTTTSESAAPLPDYGDELGEIPTAPNDASLPDIDPQDSAGV